MTQNCRHIRVFVENLLKEPKPQTQNLETSKKNDLYKDDKDKFLELIQDIIYIIYIHNLGPCFLRVQEEAKA
jgi:hypothetical protein